jgi:hypothetical protein
VLVSSGFPGFKHDLTISRLSGYTHILLNSNENAIGDKAYQGPPCFVTSQEI